MAEARSQKDLDVVLIGKTGNGKSATGNSILGEKLFLTKSQPESVTTEVKSVTRKCGNYMVKVVDTPGLSDTGLTLLQDKKKAVRSMTDVFEKCSTGVHVVAVVVRLDARLTPEEKQVFQTLKSIFGNEYLKEYGMVIVTHGDAFDNMMEEDASDLTFEEWIKKDNLGPLGDLFKECEYRCVLFDNRAKDDRIKTEQLNKFFTVAEILRNKGIYSNKYFREFENERNKLIDQYQVPYMKRSIQKNIEVLRAVAGDLEKGNGKLTDIKNVVDVLLNEVDKEKNNLLNDIKTDLEKIKKECEKQPWTPKEIKISCDELEKHQSPPYGYWEVFKKFGAREVCYALFGCSELHIGWGTSNEVGVGTKTPTL